MLRRPRAVGPSGCRASSPASPARADAQRPGDRRGSPGRSRRRPPGRADALEFDLLAVLARDPGVVVRRASLLDRVWGRRSSPTSTSSTSTSPTCDASSETSGRARFVETVRGIGYRCARPPDVAAAVVAGAPPARLPGRGGRRARTVGVAVVLVGPGYFAEAMGHGPATRRRVWTRRPASPSPTRCGGRSWRRASSRSSRPPWSARRAARIAGPSPPWAPPPAGSPAATMQSASRSPSPTSSASCHHLQRDGGIAGGHGAAASPAGRRRGPRAADSLTTLDATWRASRTRHRPAEETWRLLRTETGRLTRLVADLAELWRPRLTSSRSRSRRSSGRARLEIRERFAPLAAPRDVRIDLELQPAVARADRDRVAQVLSNYLSNALRHAPTGARSRSERVCWTVGRGSRSRTAAGAGRGPARDGLRRFYRVDPARRGPPAAPASGSPSSARSPRRWAAGVGGEPRARKGATFLLELPSA